VKDSDGSEYNVEEVTEDKKPETDPAAAKHAEAVHDEGDLTPDSVTIWSSGNGGSTFRVCNTDLGKDLSGTVSDLLRVAQLTGNLYVKGTLTYSMHGR
jgi:hypothetical protein